MDHGAGLTYEIDHYSESITPMQSPDNYRLLFQQTAASLRAWSGFVADVARVEAGDAGSGWRLALMPAIAGACPVEIVLHGGRPRCDLQVAGETYEDWEPGSLDILVPLVEAVTEGRVVRRQLSSAMTGLALATTTVIDIGPGRRIELPSSDWPVLGSAVQVRETHFLPYRPRG